MMPRWLDAAPALVAGCIVGAFAFVALALALGAISYHSDRSLVDRKIAAAIQDGTIQSTDPSGIDTFTDCQMLTSLRLMPSEFLPNLFTTHVHVGHYIGEIHPCDVLARLYTDANAAASFPVENYSRYWWGSATLANIALGRTALSVEQYRNLVFAALLLALSLFTVSFYYSYRPQSLYFTPYLISVWFGFSLLSLGRSISQSPEETFALLILSIYGMMQIETRSIFARATCYSVLGAVCVYFDLLNGVIILVGTILCCQWIASVLSAHSAQSKTKVTRLIGNLSLFGVGACFAVLIRLVGYSRAMGTSLSGAISEWKNMLAYRVTGDLPGAGEPTFRLMVEALKNTRALPFDGIFPKHVIDLWYVLGLVGWVILAPLCWNLLKKRALPLTVLSGFFLAGALVPVWFVVFKQHTIIHSWMTGRLLTLFAGLGMSAALVTLGSRKAWVEDPVKS